MIPLIQTIIFVAYLTFILIKFGRLLKSGELHSISNSWYLLDTKHQPLFTLFTWGIGIPMLFYNHWLFFLAGSGLAFVGAATQFKLTNSSTPLVHYIGAALGIGLTAVGLGVVGGYWFLLVLLALGGGLMKWKVKLNFIFWFEVYAFVLLLPFLYLL
tara:strand:- start:1158 stop:1628 length:471 start_codon:yes stop_codon:yes gene_type:complete